MKPWPRRRARNADRSIDASDVFDQPEKSLLAEAFSRPLGIAALLLLVLAAGAFMANHFMWAMDRVNDFAMVGLFVAGGILLSLLLRSGEPKPGRAKSVRLKREAVVIEPDAPTGFGQLEEEGEVIGLQSRGLAEEPASGAPIPAGAAATQPHVVDAEQDDEVAGYERALLHYAERGDLHGQGEVLRQLGHTAKTRGHLAESREFYVNSRNCFKETDDHYAEAAVLLDLGQVLESLGDQDAASAAYRDANRALLDVAMNSSHQTNGPQAQAAD